MARPRVFDPTKVLDALTCVFWRKGYEGTSYADLTAAAGVERPALYSAFGNKEALFRKVLARYYDRYLDYFPTAMAQPTAHEVVRSLMFAAAEFLTRDPQTPGCLGINGALAGSEDSEAVRLALIEARGQGEVLLRERLELAQAEGDLPETARPEALASFVMAVLHGMAVQAKAGFGREKLEAIAEQAMAGFPAA